MNLIAGKNTYPRLGAGVPAMALDGITKSFGSPAAPVEILHGIDVQIRTGEFTLIMGPSGSGKTTLLTIMGLLERPNSGTICLGGVDVSNCSEHERSAARRRSVSFVFQAFNLLSALTAAENVQVGVELHGLTHRAATARSHELLDQVGLAHRRNHRPAELSGGEKQRVGIARALASPAHIVLADEPTGNLDRRASQAVVELLRSLAHEQHRAVIVVTHDVRLEALADRVVRLEDGRIISDEEAVQR